MSGSSVVRGTGDIFPDLGLPDTGERQTKTRLALALNRIIKDRGLNRSTPPACLAGPSPRSRRWSITGSKGFRSRN